MLTGEDYLISPFIRWCSSSGVKSFEESCDLVLVEQLEPSYQMSEQHLVKIPALPDECVLTHTPI
ncbi:unnamed protein product [Tetraodon nigroviridis]|uniref:(spotted green pufferfish) hypothetical protein n=1 Tax=Tetraodon nigroviridis TaxID=99883 RepID=Q4TA91_TETNG|nr:unnamed protein product [Tetraodon nigroviridis]